MSRSMYPVLAERSFVSCSLIKLLSAKTGYMDLTSGKLLNLKCTYTI
jgi:hypothetical protein